MKDSVASTIKRVQWYDMIATAEGLQDEQRNNAALLERRFLNPEQRYWSPAIGVCEQRQSETISNRGSGALAGRIFDIVNPEMPNIGSEPRYKRLN
jgi:hypothetical protein